jgi:hypothetical protein
MLHLPGGWRREHELMTVVRRSLRPARNCGLTGPDLVTAARMAPPATQAPGPLSLRQNRRRLLPPA